MGLEKPFVVVNIEKGPQGEENRTGKHKKGLKGSYIQEGESPNTPKNQVKYIHYFPILGIVLEYRTSQTTFLRLKWSE